MTKLRNSVLPAYMALCIMLGGASAAGHVANFILQILAIGLLGWSLASPSRIPCSPGERRLTWLLIALCGLALLQFLPLPFSLWSLLGERSQIARFAELAGFEIAYPAISLMPHESLKSIVWMLPALAVTTWMIRTRAYKPGPVAWSLIAMTGVSLVVGAVQIGGGPENPYYFYEITNRGSTVGFFANSNHLATLLLVSIPFIAASAVSLSGRHRAHEYPMLAGAMGITLVVLTGIFVNGSLTGYALVLPVLAASLLIRGKVQKIKRFAPYMIGVLVLLGISLPFLTQEGAAMIGASASLAPGDRRVIFANTIRAAMDYGPLGSGIGSFREIYRQYEDPLEVTRNYVNHAHNDYLEVLLETGIVGALLLALFLCWWFWRVVKIWDVPDGCAFGKAATIASGVVLVHSLVDYPLRTAAIGCIFAFSIALMARRTNYEGPPPSMRV